jgi:hypothetical protein
MVQPRRPGTTVLQHSLLEAAWNVLDTYSAYQGSPIYSSRVSESLREEYEDRLDRLLSAIRNPPAWRDFSLGKKASISVQTGTGFRWLFGWTNFAQDTVDLTDSAIFEWVNGGWDQVLDPPFVYGEDPVEQVEVTEYLCADPSKQFVGMTEACEIPFESDCFTISRAETRGESLVPMDKNFYRLFGCQDYFYTLDVLSAELAATLVKVDAALGTEDTGGVDAIEWLDSANDEITSTADAIEDTKLTVFPYWLIFGGAALAFVLVKK